MTFDQCLKRLMLKRGLSQSELARRMGVSRVCVHQWYWGINEPNLEKLVRLKQILGCTWEELLGDE